MNKPSEAQPKKKSFWALLKESMNKASSGCGPGCGCHVQKPREENQDSETEKS